MSERIRFSIDAAVRGLDNVRSMSSATERLSQDVEETRQQFRDLNSTVKKMDSFDKAKKGIARLADQLDKSKAKHKALSRQIDTQKEKNKGFRAEIKATQREIVRLNTAMEDAGEEGLEEFREKLILAERSLENLNKESENGKSALIELGTANTRAARSIETLTNRKIAQIQRARTLRSELRSAGVETNSLSTEQARLAQNTERASEQLARQSARLRETQAAQGRIENRQQGLSQLTGDAGSLAVQAMPLVGSIAMGMKNESSFANVAKVLDSTPKELDDLNKWSLDVSATQEGAGMSANDINAMLAAGAQSGIKDIAELKAFVKDSVAMGVAFDIDANTAGETMSIFKSSMGLTQDGARTLSGLANHLSNNSGAKAKDIAEVMAREGSSAISSGFSLNEATAIAASLLSNGMGEERSATALKIIGSRLSRGFAATREHKISYARIGLDAETVSEDMQHDATGTFKYVLDAIADAPQEDQSALISRIFGEEVKGAVASLANNTANLEKTLKFARQSDKIHLDSIQKEYQTRIDTSEIKWLTFTNQISRLSIIVGDSMLPALNAVLKPLGAGIDALSDLAEANKGITAAVGVGVAAFVALKGVMMAASAASMLLGNTLDRNRIRNLRRERDPIGSSDRGGGVGNDRAERRGGLGKILKPLGIVTTGAVIAGAMSSGDTEGLGAALGDMSGAVLGGSIGAAIGSFLLPGIGTAVGGFLGSVGGSYAGEFFGSQIVDKLEKPDVIAQKIAAIEQQKTQAAMQSAHVFSPVITIHPSKNMDEVGIAQQAINQMNIQYAHLMSGNTISTRLATSSIDID